VNWPIILTILGSFAAGCGVTLWEVGALKRTTRLADPMMFGDEITDHLRQLGTIEVEISDAGEVVAVRTFPHLIAALQGIAGDPEVYSDGFSQIVLTNISEHAIEPGEPL
jgi:hypothetical protein